jgi:hypothetical protein
MHQYSKSLLFYCILSLSALAQCGAPMPMTEAGPAPALARILTEAGSVAACPGGSTYRFTCSPTCDDGPRSCANAPVIRVCDASQSDMACMTGAAGAVLAEGSANCGGACTGVLVACPAMGVVKLAGFNETGGVFLCEARGRLVPTM